MTFEQVMEFTNNVSRPDALQDIECKALYGCLMEVPSNGIVVEIGCQLGRSSSIIAQVQKERLYHAIHIDPYTEQPEYFKGWTEMMEQVSRGPNREFTFLCMRTLQAEWFLTKLWGIDLAFIDGDHEYASVMTDLHLVADRIKRGGYLTAHDYANEGLPGVKKALGEYIDLQWHQMGVFGSLGVWLKK